jgi:hypothetical protein
VSVFVLSFKYGEQHVTWVDKICLLVGFVGIGLLMLPISKLYAVLLAITIDVLAFIPTVRKSWLKPYEETISLYALTVIKTVIVLAAFDSHVWIVILHPIAVITYNSLFVLFLLWRRMQIVPTPI